MKSDNSAPDDGWLADENPDLYHLLRAADGDAEALAWLRRKDGGLGLFAEALAGDRHALEKLRHLPSLDLDGLFGPPGEPPAWLNERHPMLFLLLNAVRGDADSLKRLRRKASLARLAEVARLLYRPGAEDGPEVAAADTLDGAAADVGCLVGEMHLREHEYQKAIEAFTRAIETSPTADAFEGRARAYHALARADVARAEQLRAAPVAP
jgi:tetratricopeptide (TPR) repeat protein